jgi:hypothetical protein
MVMVMMVMMVVMMVVMMAMITIGDTDEWKDGIIIAKS